VKYLDKMFHNTPAQKPEWYLYLENQIY